MTLSPQAQALRNKLMLGLNSWSTLTSSEQTFLADQMRPAATGFNADQYSLLDGFYLLAPNEAAMTTLNQGRRHRLAKSRDSVGNWLTVAWVLTDMSTGEPFNYAHSTIINWLIVHRSPSQITSTT